MYKPTTLRSPAWPLSLISRGLVVTQLHPPPPQPRPPPPHILPLLQGVAVMMRMGWRLDGLVSNYCHCLIKFNICILKCFEITLFRMFLSTLHATVPCILL